MASSRIAFIMTTSIVVAACSFEWGVRQDTSVVDAGDDGGADAHVIRPGFDSGSRLDAGADRDE